MNTFKEKLTQELSKSRFNNYTDNYDEMRFGPNPERFNLFIKIFFILNKFFKSIFFRKSSQAFALNTIKNCDISIEELSYFYNILDDSESRNLLIKLISYRLLGYKKYKLPMNNKSFWKTRKTIQSLVIKSTKTINSETWTLKLFDLKKIGYKIKLYCSNIQNTFISKQYEYKSSSHKKIAAGNGETVFDLGACWGDTSLYFANLVKKGKVYAFEPFNENIKILNINFKLNPKLSKKIKVNKNPIWSSSGKYLQLIESGPGTRTIEGKINKKTNINPSISIDDFVKTNKLKNVDFIKMDIEGTELPALKGALNTIKKFKPKLAIAIYHSANDFVNIPKFIKENFPFYNLYLGHYTIHNEETVIFANPK